MQSITIPNLATHETAYQLPTGETVAVGIFRLDNSVKPLRLCVTARHVDDTGATVTVNDTPVEIMPLSFAIDVQQITDESLQAILAQVRQDAAQKIVGHAKALRLVHAIPVLPAPAGPYATL